VLVVTRYRVAPDEAATFQLEARAALDVLALQKGWLSGRLGRNVDEPELWVLTTEWENVGSYRRALSPFEVKVTAVPLLSRCLDEPSAFELVEVLGARATD
jgi:quinol monooxygenase YgiN